MTESATPAQPTTESHDSRGHAVPQPGSAQTKVWMAVGITGLSLLTITTILAVVQFRQIEQLRRELQTLKAESVRYGQSVEIFDPAWGTVIDAVDPQRIPSRDGRDPRYGAVVQQYTPGATRRKCGSCVRLLNGQARIHPWPLT